MLMSKVLLYFSFFYPLDLLAIYQVLPVLHLQSLDIIDQAPPQFEFYKNLIICGWFLILQGHLFFIEASIPNYYAFLFSSFNTPQVLSFYSFRISKKNAFQSPCFLLIFLGVPISCTKKHSQMTAGGRFTSSYAFWCFEFKCRR